MTGKRPLLLPAIYRPFTGLLHYNDVLVAGMILSVVSTSVYFHVNNDTSHTAQARPAKNRMKLLSHPFKSSQSRFTRQITSPPKRERGSKRISSTTANQDLKALTAGTINADPNRSGIRLDLVEINKTQNYQFLATCFWPKKYLQLLQSSTMTCHCCSMLLLLSTWYNVAAWLS